MLLISAFAFLVAAISAMVTAAQRIPDRSALLFMALACLKFAASIVTYFLWLGL